MEIRKHVVSSAWASGCTVSQTYGRNYQRKMEITSGLGLIRSPEQSHCVRTILGSGAAGLGARCSRPFASRGQRRELACAGLLPFTRQQRLSSCCLSTAPRGPSSSRVTSREPWAAPHPALPFSSSLALPVPALCHCQEQDGSGHLIRPVTPSGKRGLDNSVGQQPL